MLTFINSSKTMDFDDKIAKLPSSQPVFEKEAKALSKKVTDMGYEQMQEMMGISDKLAALNFQRYIDLNSSPRNPHRQAILAYRGDVYDGLGAKNIDKKDLSFGQDHLRIISGLYGILRPFDSIEPYRMEMAYKFKVEKYSSLSEYWQHKVKKELKSQLQKTGNVLINLASKEYSVILEPLRNQVEWVDVKFLDQSKGKYRFITLYGKRARGMMARFIMENKVETVSQLKDFDEGGYRFSKVDSDENLFVFKR